MPNELFEELRQIVPEKVSKFEKLGGEGSAHYAFLRYGMDLADQFCLYYRNHSVSSESMQIQRVVLDELDQLLEATRMQKMVIVDRDLFRKYCPRSSKYPSAYTVAVRLMEHAGIGRYFGRQLVLFAENAD
jgi:hypothetical protein